MLDFQLTQPEPRGLNKKLPKSKSQKRGSDEDRSAPGPHHEGWDLVALGYRRALKIGITQNEQDISRCYQNIPTGMYRKNLEAARIRRTCPRPMEVQMLHPDKSESQCAMKNVTKKEERGAQAVKRKKGPTSRIYKRRRSIEELQKNTPGRDCYGDGRSSNHCGVTIEMALEESLASLEQYTHPNINTGLGKRSIAHDEAEVEGFEMVFDEYTSSVEEIELEYILL